VSYINNGGNKVEDLAPNALVHRKNIIGKMLKKHGHVLLLI